MTMKQPSFFQSVLRIAVPVALQSMLQSSFSMIDQVMVGQLGSTGIAAVGIAGKFAFLYSVVVGAVTAIAGTYLPIGAASTLSVMLRCNDRAKAPL